MRQLTTGKVLVYDYECLQCEYFGEYKPAVFANYRYYIYKYAGKRVIYNSEIFDSKSQIGLKSKLKSLNVDYVYVTKYSPLIEKLKFSPGDYGIKKIFENAVVQIWEVVK